MFASWDHFGQNIVIIHHLFGYEKTSILVTSHKMAMCRRRQFGARRQFGPAWPRGMDRISNEIDWVAT